MNSIKILATGAGSPGAGSIFKSFRLGAKEEGRKVEIVAVDMEKLSYGFHLADKYYVIPPAKSPDFLDKILELCEREKPDLLFSWVDPELVPLAENRKVFESVGTKVVLSSAEALKIAGNKIKCYEKISDLGYAPKFVFANTVDDIEKAAKKLGSPEKTVCYKPEVAHGSRGFRIIMPNVSRADLLFNEKPTNIFTTLEETKQILSGYKNMPNMMVMEYLNGLEGKEYSLDILVDDNGPIVSSNLLWAVIVQDDIPYPIQSLTIYSVVLRSILGYLDGCQLS